MIIIAVVITENIITIIFRIKYNINTLTKLYMNKEKFSIIISRIYDFYIIAPLISILLIVRYRLKFNFFDVFLLIIVPLIFFLLFLIFEIYKKGIDKIDFDIEDSKNKRLILIFIISFWSFLVFLILYFQHYNYSLLMFILMFSIIIFIAFLITFFWKISFHAIMSTSLFVVSLAFSNLVLSIILFLLIPVVCFARYTLKKHTISQLIGGFSLVIIVFIIFHIYS